MASVKTSSRFPRSRATQIHGARTQDGPQRDPQAGPSSQSNAISAPRTKSTRPIPTLDLERSLWAGGSRYVVGLDEVGRGCVCGCVMTAAVVLAPSATEEHFSFVRDSKLMSRVAIRKSAAQIMANPESHVLAWGLGAASAREIDSTNIRLATIKAMRRALIQVRRKIATRDATIGSLPLDRVFDAVVVDGIPMPELGVEHLAIPKADAHVLTVATASNLAKFHRDRLMTAIATRHPEYECLARCVGYISSVEHLTALRTHGPLLGHHRMTFAPVSGMRQNLQQTARITESTR